LAEQGFAAKWPDGAWLGIFAPAQPPEAVVTRINAVVNDTLADEEYHVILRRLGLWPLALSPAQLAEQLTRDHEATGQALHRIGLV
jgi:tripartite-type tricarboxylate transporter receptor subunit TctC